MNIADALRLIAAKSPNNVQNAVRALRSVSNNTPVAMSRAQYVLREALIDPLAEFTTEERTAIAALLEGDDSRTADIRLRVTPAEKARVQEMAEEAGVTVSDFIRERIGL